MASVAAASAAWIRQRPMLNREIFCRATYTERSSYSARAELEEGDLFGMAKIYYDMLVRRRASQPYIPMQPTISLRERILSIVLAISAVAVC